MSPPSSPTLNVAYLFPGMENDDEFVSFPHISPLFKGDKTCSMSEAGYTVLFMYTWFTFSPSFTRARLSLHNWVNAHVCCWPSASLCVPGRREGGRGGFLPRRARNAAPRPSNRKKSEIENPEDTNYDKSSLSSSPSFEPREKNAHSRLMRVMQCLSRPKYCKF